MSYLSTKISTIRMPMWANKSLSVLMLTSLVAGHPVSATNAQNAEPVAAVAVASEEITPPATPPSVQEVLLDVCEKRGYGEDCAKTLFGMLWTESSNRSTVIGDGGRARGYFQIHYRLHKIPVACAEDLVCSANWSLSYLERNHYPKYVNYAIQCHNSCNVKNGYVAKVKRHAALLWDQPLEINQVAPIQLASK